MGHDVSDTFYFLVCNANRKADGFFGKLEFEEVLVPYKWNAQWIPKKVSEMIDCMNSEEIPKSNVACKNCAYARQRININLDLFLYIKFIWMTMIQLIGIISNCSIKHLF